MRRGLVSVVIAVLCGAGCASRGARYGPASPERAARALEAWGNAVERAAGSPSANLLYDATLSQGLLRTDGTLAVRLRGERVDGTLAGPLGTPVAKYEGGVLRGEKLQPVALPPAQLRAVLAGVWDGAAPEVAGERGEQVLLRWSGEAAAEGVFDVSRGKLLSLRVRRPEGELLARFSGGRDPWPEKIEIEEKKTRNKLGLRLLSWEAVP